MSKKLLVVVIEEGTPDPVLIVRALLALKARRDAKREEEARQENQPVSGPRGAVLVGD